MCQCHDSYEPLDWRPAKPVHQVITQCHDLYEPFDPERPVEATAPEVPRERVLEPV